MEGRKIVEGKDQKEMQMVDDKDLEMIQFEGVSWKYNYYNMIWKLVWIREKMV